jgi:hypothetical protein
VLRFKRKFRRLKVKAHYMRGVDKITGKLNNRGIRMFVLAALKEN